MMFGDGSAAAKTAADAAKAAVRSTDNFNWTFIALLALVVVGVYIPNIKKKCGYSFSSANVKPLWHNGLTHL